MKKIFEIFKIENLKQQLDIVWSRFPLSLLIIFIFTGILFTIVNFDTELAGETIQTLAKVSASLVLTFFLSVAFYITTENLDYATKKRNLLQIIPLVFGVLFYFGFTNSMDNSKNMVFFLLSILGIISYLFFAPYIQRTEKQSIFYTYFYNIFIVFGMGFTLGFILGILGFLGITTVDTLFDLHIEKRHYINWIILALGFITPLFALTKLPNKKSFRNNHFNENIFFSFLIKNILVPFICVYFLILYTYSVKVLLNFHEWPKGEVSWMVIGFSIIGYLAYIFSYIFEDKNTLIRGFRKYFPIMVIPQIFMLFYAIYLRIAQHDITTNRYFVVVFGIWLLVISLYYTISKTKDLKVIPAILTLFTILISVGPWSVYQLPNTRQEAKLISNLKQAGILVNGKIVPAEKNSDIPMELRKMMFSEIEYLSRNNYNQIEKLFPDQYKKIIEESKALFDRVNTQDLKNIEKNADAPICEYSEDRYPRIISQERCYDINSKTGILERTYTKPHRWEMVHSIIRKLNIETYNIEETNTSDKHFSLYANNFEAFPLNVKGYSTVLELENTNRTQHNGNGNPKTYAYFDIHTSHIYIMKNNEKAETIDISQKLTYLYELYKKQIWANEETRGKDIVAMDSIEVLNKDKEITPEELSFTVQSNGVSYKVILRNITVRNPEFSGILEQDYYYDTSGFLMY